MNNADIRIQADVKQFAAKAVSLVGSPLLRLSGPQTEMTLPAFNFPIDPGETVIVTVSVVRISGRDQPQLQIN